MSDANKYINYYVEHSLGMVHEYINTLLQTKTQLRVLEDQVKEKDAAIASLQNELNGHLTNQQELDRAVTNAATWENSYNDLRNKVSHMDTLTNQIGEAKKLLVDRNNQVEKLNNLVEELKTQVAEKDGQIKQLKKFVPSVPSPKKTINSSKKSTSVSEEVPNEKANTVIETVEAKAKPPIVPYKPTAEGTKPKLVPFVPPVEKTEDKVAVKVVNVVEKPEETDDF